MEFQNSETTFISQTWPDKSIPTFKSLNPTILGGVGGQSKLGYSKRLEGYMVIWNLSAITQKPFVFESQDLHHCAQDIQKPICGHWPTSILTILGYLGGGVGLGSGKTKSWPPCNFLIVGFKAILGPLL